MKKSRGRQKIKLKFIEDKKSRAVTFSKRRDGIYRKVSELCVLTGIDIAILITSMRGKTFSFAHPNVEKIASKFLHQHELPKGILEPYQEVHIQELYQQLDEVRDKLEVEEKRASVLKELKHARAKNVWEEPMKEFTRDEAEKVKEQLYKVQASLFKMVNEQNRQHITQSALKA